MIWTLAILAYGLLLLGVAIVGSGVTFALVLRTLGGMR